MKQTLYQIRIKKLRIREMLLCGITYREIAKTIKCSYSTIRKVMKDMDVRGRKS